MTRFIAELSPELAADHEAGNVINVATVYGHLFDKALARDGQKRVLLNPRDRHKILESLALHFWRHQTAVMAIDDLEDWFDAYVETVPALQRIVSHHLDARDLLQTELRNASLLVRQNETQFSFVHISFQEYFLALGLRNALLKGADNVLDLPASISQETVRFLIDSAARDNKLPDVERVLAGMLTNNMVSVEARQKAFSLLKMGYDQGWRIPQGANLSGLT